MPPNHEKLLLFVANIRDIVHVFHNILDLLSYFVFTINCENICVFGSSHSNKSFKTMHACMIHTHR